ncbi:MAG: hypothetical protein PHV61_00405 [Limnochordia bacterium]|nr:hypothetical protein [Limnochordia bacterium]
MNRKSMAVAMTVLVFLLNGIVVLAATDNLICLDVFSSDIRNALQDLAYEADVVILVDDYIQGYVTLSLTDVTVDRAIEVLCMKGGFGFKKLEEGLYVVGSTEPNNPTFQKYADTKVVHVDYLDAEEVISLLSHYEMYLSAKNGVLTVRAWQNQMSFILADISAIDQPIRQVEGKVIIAEVTAEAKAQLGLGRIVGGLPSGNEITLGGPGGVTIGFSDSLTIASLLHILQAEGKALLKATTSIVVPEGSESTISIGREVRQLVKTQVNSGYTIENLKVNTYLTLGVERITSKDEIRLSYEVVAQDLAQNLTSDIPEILSRLANGTVIVDNNSAFVIGGLTKNVEQESTGVIPPQKSKTTQDTELLIIIMPHIVGTPMPEANLMEEYVDRFTQSTQTAMEQAKSLETSTLKLRLNTYYSPGLNDYLADKGYETFPIRMGLEGQLNFTPNIGVYCTKANAQKDLTKVEMFDWGLVLQTSPSSVADAYLGLGGGSGKVSFNTTVTEFDYYAAKAGVDVKLGSLLFGIGYSYAMTDHEGLDLDTAYVTVGCSF